MLTLFPFVFLAGSVSVFQVGACQNFDLVCLDSFYLCSPSGYDPASVDSMGGWPLRAIVVLCA